MIPLRKRLSRSQVASRPARIYTDGEIQRRIADLPFAVQLVMMSAMESLIQCEIHDSLNSLTAAREDVRSLQSHLDSLVVEGFQESEAVRDKATRLEDCDDKDRCQDDGNRLSTVPKNPKVGPMISSTVLIQDEVANMTSEV